MNISDQERVEDILEFAQILTTLVANGHEEFRNEVVLQLSIERLIISIGEACNKISPEFQATHPEIPWRDIVSMRNLLIHAYQRTDLIQVWKAASEGIPELVQNLKTDF